MDENGKNMEENEKMDIEEQKSEDPAGTSVEKPLAAPSCGQAAEGQGGEPGQLGTPSGSEEQKQPERGSVAPKPKKGQKKKEKSDDGEDSEGTLKADGDTDDSDTEDEGIYHGDISKQLLKIINLLLSTDNEVGGISLT